MHGEQQTARSVWLRVGAFAALVALSGLALPLSAYVVEAVSSRAENWIIVMYLALMAALGGAVGAGAPALSPPALSRRRAVLLWGILGLVAATVGATLWLVLVAG